MAAKSVKAGLRLTLRYFVECFSGNTTLFQWYYTAPLRAIVVDIVYMLVTQKSAWLKNQQIDEHSGVLSLTRGEEFGTGTRVG